MVLLFSVLMLAQPMGDGDCVYDAVPVGMRSSIGEAVLARRQGRVELDVLQKAVDSCAQGKSWTVEKALHANGYATMRFVADSIAGKLGNPQWSLSALKAVRARPSDQIQNLASTGSGNAEFELVLAQMISEDRKIAAVLQEESKENLESFALMIKALAIAETERLKI